MGLNNKLMIANLTIRKWSGTKLDKEASSDTNARYNVSDKAVRVYKSLMPKESLQKVRKADNAVYSYYYKNTLPWGNDGRRVLPAQHYFEFTQKIRALISKAEKEVLVFLQNYTHAILQAEVMLGDVFNRDDYPLVEDIAGQFGIDLDFEPLPDAGDFRVDLANEDVEKIREQIAEQQKDRTAQAMRELWDRTYKVVKNMSERLGDPDGKFKNSLVGNVHDMVTLLSRMNVTDDPELGELRGEIEKTLVRYDAQVLRDDDVARIETANAANDILERMAAYTGGVQ